MIIKKNLSWILTVFLVVGISSCSESKSYSELLNEEGHAVNWYLASQKVINEVPADSVSFIIGDDAPFYKLDEDGYVYMQVVSKGDMTDKVKSGDLVYFRFNRLNLKYLYLGQDPVWEGNSTDLVTSMGTYENDPNYTRFIYENKYLSSTTKWGTGIQMPLKFFGYDCEVNLVLRSYYGFQEDQTTCMPYLINLRYFKPEY